MKWTPWLIGSLCIATVAGCKGNRNDTNTTGGPGTESGASAGAATDTTMGTMGRSDTTMGTMGRSDTSAAGATGGTSADTARNRAAGGTPSKSAKGNQTKSGVTDKSGKSTLGPGVTQTRPDQNQPVTSKGDTIRKGNDSTAPGSSQ
jgi:hypothetical protein